MNPPALRCAPFVSLPWAVKISALGLGAAIVAFAAVLWPAWRQDDNLTHGPFLPFLAGILVMESRRDPTPRFLRSGAAALAGGTCLLLAALGSFAIALLYAAALGWSYMLAEFALATALVFALGAAWLAFADQRVRFIPINWAAFVAIILWLFASPLPPGTYARLAFFLQTEVTDGVVRLLNAVGIAAFRDGHVIELARTSVGVSEACSGIRSLISCTVAGLFLSALLVHRPRNRALVIALSPAIGLAMNFLRSLLLTLLANRGVAIEGRWHDLTGAAILVVTTLLVLAFALWLHRHEPVSGADRGETVPPLTGRSSLLPGMIAGALLMVAGTAALLAARQAPSAAREGPAPDLAAIFPTPPPGWAVATIPGLDAFSDILQTHDLFQRVYSSGPTPDSAHVTLYLAYWRPAQTPVSLVDLHTPDACWPGAGWEPRPVPDEHAMLGIGGRILAPAEFRLFAHHDAETRVWFWHLYGGRPLTFVDPYSATHLLKTAWRYGFSRPQEQLFVVVSSNRPWPEVASLPAFRQFFANLEPLGL